MNIQRGNRATQKTQIFNLINKEMIGMPFLAYLMHKVNINFYFFYFLNVLNCAIFSNKKLVI